MNFEEKLDEIEHLIKIGNAKKASSKINHIPNIKLPRRLLARYANLCRRCGQNFSAINVLSPKIKLYRESNANIYDAELAEYGATLLRLGVTQEGLDLLSLSNDEKYPLAAFYKILAYNSQWDYEKSIPVLNKILENKSLPPYQLLVCEVNLAAAYIFTGKLAEAEKILLESITHHTKKNNSLLLGNCNELFTQLLFAKKEYRLAKKHITKAKDIDSNFQGANQLFISKWEILIDLYTKKGKSRQWQNLENLRLEAIKRNHFETIRHCDYHTGIIKEDYSLLNHVYWGTPFNTLRANLLNDASNWQPDKSYFIGNKNNLHFLDPKEKSSQHNYPTKLKDRNKKSLNFFLKDFYRRPTITNLFTEIYSNEYYHPHFSPQKVSNTLSRCNKDFEENSFPIKITHKNHFYHLESEVTFILSSELSASSDDNLFYLDAIKKELGDRPLKFREIQQTLNLSKQKTHFFIKEAIDKDSMQAKGKGRAIRYILKLAS